MAEIQVNRNDIHQRWKPEQIDSIIRFQILVYCHLAGIWLTQPRLECLTAIGVKGKVALNDFCIEMAQKGLFASSQSTRNVLDELTTLKLVIKEGRNMKTIYLNPALKIQCTGNILVDIKAACY